MKRIIFIIPALLTAVHGFSQFRAEMEMSMKGNELVYDVYAGNERYRYEFEQGGQQVALIINPQGSTSYMLIHAEKIYMSMANDNMMKGGNDPMKNYNDLKNNCTEKVVGEETIEGYLCKKTELYKNDEKIMTVWRCEELNFPLKLTDHKEDLSMALKNIEKWDPDPAMFIVPENYTNIMQ